MTCPFVENYTKVTSRDINGDPLSFEMNSYCKLRNKECMACTFVSVSNRNSSSKLTFYRPDHREEIILNAPEEVENDFH